MTTTKQSSGELKSRVNTCLNKLSDRDTLSIATVELESIAKNLQNDAFAPFLNCLTATDTSDKSPVRRQCVRLLSVLSAAHGDAMSPHASKMISAVVRRLRDPDSAVRSACVDAVTSITENIKTAPFNAVLKPFVEVLFREQDSNAQIGAAMCLTAAAVAAGGEIDVPELRKVMPRVLKLVRSEGFKAKAALLAFIGSSVVAVKGKSLLSSVVGTAVEFLSNGDWGVRKAAAEVLEKAAVTVAVELERDLVVELKVCCVDALESKRFDRVKVVRETMNRALEAWKDVPLLSEELSSSLEDSSSNGNSSALFTSSPSDSDYETPQIKKTMPSRSPVSSGCSSTSVSQKSIATMDRKTCTSSSVLKLNLRNNMRSKVIPFNLIEDTNMADKDSIKDEPVDQAEFEDMSLIRKQLLQIENQQSNLLQLLQRFIGNSQKGMSCLEQRVDGLEKVLGEMSQDLAISTRRIPSADSGGNTCCMLPGAEFLSPKFWRKAEGGQHVGSKFNSSFRNQSSRKNATTSVVELPRVDSPRS